MRILLRRLSGYGHGLSYDTREHIRRTLIAGESAARDATEIAALAHLQPVTWSAIAHEAAVALGALERVFHAVARVSGAEAIATSVESSLVSFREAVPATISPRWEASVSVPVDKNEQMQLARHALRAVKMQAQLAKAIDTRNERNQAVELCVPLAHHLSVASDALLHVADRSTRLRILPEVEGTSTSLGYLASFLSASPRMKWHRAFAAVFDAENSVRKTVGLVPVPRPYSGSIDPAEALSMLEGTARGGTAPPALVGAAFETPAGALSGIAVGLDHVFEQQLAAVTQLGKDLQAEWPAPTEPWYASLIKAGAMAALSAAAGGLGAIVANAIKSRLESGLLKSVAGTALRHLSGDEKQIVLAQSGVLARAIKIDSAKDASKQLFRDALAGVASNGGASDPLSINVLDAFIAAQRAMVGEARHAGRLLMAHLLEALAGADLDALNALSTVLNNDLPSAALSLQYDRSMTEWLNLKARLGDGRQHEDSKGPAAIDERHVDGVLEIDVALNTDTNTTTVRSLSLHGARPAEYEHLKRKNALLSQLGLHQRYALTLLTYMDQATVVIGVSPDHALQLASLSGAELDVLRIYAVGDKVTTTNRVLAQRGYYSHVDNSHAVRVASLIIKSVANTRTGALQVKQ